MDQISPTNEVKEVQEASLHQNKREDKPSSQPPRPPTGGQRMLWGVTPTWRAPLIFLAICIAPLLVLLALKLSASCPSPPPLHCPTIPQTPNLQKPFTNIKMSSSEQTFIAVKPDGVQRGLVGPIISRFESRGFKLVAIKVVQPGQEHLEKHYADLKDKPFFPSLIQYMNSGPIVATVWEGRDAVKQGRAILGATNPLASAPGTIRGDYALVTGRNVAHGSDSVENAKKEIDLWFKPEELVSWKSAQHSWIYEE